MISVRDIDEWMISVEIRLPLTIRWFDTVYGGPSLQVFGKVRSGEIVDKPDLELEMPIPMPLIHNRDDWLAWLRWVLERIAINEVHQSIVEHSGKNNAVEPVFDEMQLV